MPAADHSRIVDTIDDAECRSNAFPHLAGGGAEDDGRRARTRRDII